MQGFMQSAFKDKTGKAKLLETIPEVENFLLFLPTNLILTYVQKNILHFEGHLTGFQYLNLRKFLQAITSHKNKNDT